MTKIKKFLSVEKIDFKKVLFLSLLAVVLVSPFKAKAGVLQDIYNGLVDGLTASPCTIDAGEEFCMSKLVYFPRGRDYDRNFTISSHLEDKIEMKKIKILLGAVTYYKGEGKVEYKTTRFDLKDSQGKIVAQIHGYAIPGRHYLREKRKNESSLSVEDCQIQPGSSTCPAKIEVKIGKNYDDGFVIKSGQGEEIVLERDFFDLSANINYYFGYAPTKYPSTEFILYDKEGNLLDKVVANASCKEGSEINEDGICQVEGEGFSYGDNNSIVFYAQPGFCKIEEGGKSCVVNFGWDLTNAQILEIKRSWQQNTGRIKIFTINEDGQKEYIYDGKFDRSNPRGIKRISVDYPGAVYSLSYSDKEGEDTLDSINVLANCIEGTKWNNSYCLPYVTTGVIKQEFSYCEIAEGQESCNINLVWGTDDPDPRFSSEIKSDNKLLKKSYDGNMEVPVKYPQTTFTLEYKNKVLDTAYANSYCVAGAVWNGSKCETPPECPEYEGPDESYKAKWEDPDCNDTCSKEYCKKYDSTKIITCTTADGKKFTYDCCQSSE